MKFSPVRFSTKVPWNYAFGTQASQTDPNGTTGSLSYDDFGRRTREDRPDGTATTWDLGACVSPSFCGDTKLRYVVTASLRNTSNGVERDDVQYFDAFDRLLYDEPEQVDGSRSVVSISYNAFGRVIQRSAQYFLGSSVYWATIVWS